MVWVPAAASCLTYPEDDIRDMLAQTAAFRTWVGADNATSAKLYAFFHSLPTKDDVPLNDGDGDEFSVSFWDMLRNYVVISTADEDGFAWEYAAAPNEFLTAGTVTLEFTHYFDTYDPRPGADTRTAMNAVGQIMGGMLELSGTELFPSINSANVMMMGWEPEDQQPDVGRNYLTVIDVVWAMGNVLGAS